MEIIPSTRFESDASRMSFFTAEKVLLYAEMFSLMINEKAHNASNT
jgi:hypothetical protein